MKKKTILWIVVCALIVAGIGITVFLLIKPPQKPSPAGDGDITYSVYFLNKTKDALTEEFRTYNSQEENIAYK